MADFVITRIFKAPRQRVWDAWTKPEMLAQWFGPKGVTATVLAWDLRPGGVTHSRLETPDGNRMWARFLYREVEPPSRLAWEHSFSDADANVVPSPFPHAWPLRLLTVVLFADRGNETEVTLTWSPLDATPEQRKTFEESMASMEGGWGGSFDQLDAFLAR